jgi:hypothetical protein
MSIGVFYIFRLAHMILNDYLYAILVSFFLFTSTVFNYYSFNYLPDSPALGFVFIGWFLVFNFRLENKKRALFMGFFFLTLGGLIKVTSLVNLLAIVLFFIFSVFDNKRFLPNKKEKQVILYGLIGVLIVILWNIYVLYYNNLYSSFQFNTIAKPIWSLSLERVGVVWDHVVNYWYADYFAHSSFRVLLGMAVLQIVFFKKSNYTLSMIILILFIGNLIYFILFYSQFQDHDYYFMIFFPFFILVLINGIKTLQNVITKPLLHVFIKLVLLIVFVAGANYSKIKLSNRYENGLTGYSKTSFLIQENRVGIQRLNLKKDAKFIVVPDLCPNGGLFFLDKMGWNIASPEDLSVDNLRFYKNSGAEYLLLADDEQVVDLWGNIGDLIFKGKGISIYKISR